MKLLFGAFCMLPLAFEKAFVAQMAAKKPGILISLRCTGSSKQPSNQMIGLERFMTGTIFNFSAVRLIIFFKNPELGKSSNIILIHQV